MFPQFGAKKTSKKLLVVARDVQGSTKSSFGDGAICDDPQGIRRARENNRLLAGKSLLSGLELETKIIVLQ